MCLIAHTVENVTVRYLEVPLKLEIKFTVLSVKEVFMWKMGRRNEPTKTKTHSRPDCLFPAKIYKPIREMRNPIPIVVKKVGRKYFYCGLATTPVFRKYCIKDWSEKNDDTPDFILYESLEEYENERQQRIMEANTHINIKELTMVKMKYEYTDEGFCKVMYSIEECSYCLMEESPILVALYRCTDDDHEPSYRVRLRKGAEIKFEVPTDPYGVSVLNTFLESLKS